MVERRQHFGLAPKARHAPGVLGVRLRQHFHRHVAFQPSVSGAVDLTHAAGAQGREDLVGTQFVTHGERHIYVQFTLADQTDAWARLTRNTENGPRLERVSPHLRTEWR